MEFNTDKTRRQKLEEEDRLSALTDDVLLSILGRVDLSTAVSTSALSTRWTHLPWLLPELVIDVEDFMSDPHSNPDEVNGTHGAMHTITAATKSLFGKPRRESIVARLQLTLYLIDTFSCDIGPLVCDAIDRGLLNNLDLAILDEKKPWKSSESNMLKRAQDIDGFFRSYPSILCCLTRLSLYSLSFAEFDMHHVLFDCCTQLKHLTLSFCTHLGPNSVWTIVAPNSKLRLLELDRCLFETIELTSLPELEKVNLVGLTSNYVPLSFGFVPSLEELELAHFLFLNQHLFKLSELLHGAPAIHTLTLNFVGNTIWLQPEIKQLTSAFSKLRKLFILGVFVEFDLLWIRAFLEAAPSIEILHIEVVEPCKMEHPWPAHKRTNPRWELDFCGSKNLVLRELQIDCFRLLEQQLTFIRALLEWAPNLHIVVLRKDGEGCSECDSMALDAPPHASAWPAFPKNKEEQDMVVKRLSDGTSFTGRNPNRIGFFMEPNNDNARRRRSEEDDRLSMLPDDVLLSILGRVDLTTATRTSALSTRWRQLPWLLPELIIDADHFMSVPDSEPIDANVMHDTMLAITKAAKSLFAKPQRKSIVTRLDLKLYSINTSLSDDIGSILCDAIGRGLLKDLNLGIHDETRSCDCSHSDKLRRAKDMDGFLYAYPTVLRCLTKLCLCDMRFVEVDTHHILFDCCKQLKHLTLVSCDAGPRSLWKIDAPNSKLCVLELDMCFFERIELISLPKLEKLECALWISKYAPLSFGCVPSLEDLYLANVFDIDQHEIHLSELLHGAAGIHTLTLDFRGENIWVQAEIKQLATVLSKLKKLSIVGIFIEFDLLWTIFFLEAASSVEILHIHIWEHVCPFDVNESQQMYHRERCSPQWELNFPSSRNLLLRELQVTGFRPLEHQMTFIGSMIERAPNLLMVILKEDLEECTKCKAIALSEPPSVSPWPVFPKKKDEQDMVVRQVTDGTSFSGRVIFQ